jgi:signal transduction histidine kinase
VDRAWIGWALVGANAYALAVLRLAVLSRRSHSRSPYHQAMPIVTVLDNAIILGLMALTGGVRSPIAAILLLVITTDAARYGVELAIRVSIFDSVVLALIAAFVDAPGVTSAGRLREFVWWTWLLVGGAVLSGMIARARNVAREAKDVAEARADLEHQQLEVERATVARVQALEESRRDFLRVVSHEFRTPVKSMVALVDALTSTSSRLADAERAEAVELLRAHADHLGVMLGEVTDVAHAAAMGHENNLRLSDIDVLSLAAVAANAAGLDRRQLVVHSDVDRPMVRSDRDKLRRILSNLFDNAKRYSGAKPIEFFVRQRDEAIELAVGDRGPGIPAPALAKAFQKGFGLGPNRGSAGLGLWIVTELADNLGAKVTAANRETGGLLVYVVLPTK